MSMHKNEVLHHKFDIDNTARIELEARINTQARNVDAELSQYDVKWLKYTIKMPVIRKDS